MGNLRDTIRLSMRTPIVLMILLWRPLGVAQVERRTSYSIFSRDHLCAAIQEPGFFQNKLKYELDSQLAFRNLPGPLGRGICWWHSRFTRAANYLAIYRPDIPQKPSQDQARKIIRQIVKRSSVVEISGYRSLRDFSQDHQGLIERELNQWSIQDVIDFKLLPALEGSSRVSAPQLSSIMDALYYWVHYQKRIAFQLLQLPGLSVHSWLVVGMNKTAYGYDLDVIDSNFKEARRWHYIRGQTHFWYQYRGDLPLEGSFVPYTHREWIEEENKILRVLRQYCQRHT